MAARSSKLSARHAGATASAVSTASATSVVVASCMRPSTVNRRCGATTSMASPPAIGRRVPSAIVNSGVSPDISFKRSSSRATLGASWCEMQRWFVGGARNRGNGIHCCHSCEVRLLGAGGLCRDEVRLGFTAGLRPRSILARSAPKIAQPRRKAISCTAYHCNSWSSRPSIANCASSSPRSAASSSKIAAATSRAALGSSTCAETTWSSRTASTTRTAAGSSLRSKTTSLSATSAASTTRRSPPVRASNRSDARAALVNAAYSSSSMSPSRYHSRNDGVTAQAADPAAATSTCDASCPESTPAALRPGRVVGR